MRCVVVVLLATGCSTYVQHRAALVPHATPVQTTGQPNDWRGAAAVGATNITDLQKPSVGDNPNAGVAVPSRQFRGAIALAITRNLTLGLVHERGLASSAQPIKDNLPPLDDRTVSGSGMTWTYSIDTGSALRIALSTELIGWSIPYVEYSTCIEFCGGSPFTTITRDRASIMTLGLGVVPSYRVGAWTLFGGVTTRNHPTIEAKVVSNGFSADVEEGPWNVLLHGGVAYAAGDRVQLKLEIHQTVTRDPVAYAPGIGFGVEVGFGKPIPKTPPPPPPVMAPPGAPGAEPARRLPSPYEREQAQKLAAEAHAAAQAGECDQVRSRMARIHELDLDTYTIAMQDKLIAYCTSP